MPRRSGSPHAVLSAGSVLRPSLRACANFRSPAATARTTAATPITLTIRPFISSPPGPEKSNPPDSFWRWVIEIQLRAELEQSRAHDLSGSQPCWAVAGVHASDGARVQQIEDVEHPLNATMAH